MIRCKLSQRREVVKVTSRVLTVWDDGTFLRAQTLSLHSYRYEGENWHIAKFFVEEFEVAAFSMSATDFTALFNTFKPETNDELNTLGIAEVKTADTDQVPAAGTNNARV